MRIEDIDKNFVVKRDRADGMTEYVIPSLPFELYGVYYDEKEKGFLRMKQDIADSINPRVAVLNKNTSGGRLRFSTNSDRIEITVKYKQLINMPHMPISGSAGFTLLEDKGDDYAIHGFLMPGPDDKEGFTASAPLSGKMTDYILFFPLYNDVDSLSVFLKTDAKVGGGRKYRDIAPILYAGSSITQGGCASRPDTCYPALISKWNNIDYYNLGFSGSFLAEDSMAEYIADTECSLFVCDYDYNAPTAEHLQNTHYKLYETFRKKQPKTPVLFVSRPDGRTERAAEDFKIIKETYERAVRNGDENVYLLSGKSFYGKKEYHHCSVDGCHPTDHGFYRMATKVYNAIKKIDKKFE